jgi:hypothetical protein
MDGYDAGTGARDGAVANCRRPPLDPQNPSTSDVAGLEHQRARSGAGPEPVWAFAQVSLRQTDTISPQSLIETY